MADMYFDVDAAITECPVNLMPLIDDTDFKTRETAIAYNASGMDLVWNFVTSAGAFTQTAVTPTTAGNYDWTHQGDGMYTIEIPASGGASINNDTEGYGWFTGLVTGVLPWRGPVIGFRSAALNDSLCDTNTTGLLAPTVAARTLDVSAGGEAGVDWANVGSPTTTVNLSGTTTNVVNTATAVTTVNGLAANVITATSIATDAITAAKIAADAIGSSELATSAVDEIVDAVWDEVLSGAAHNVANSAGRRLRQLGASSITGGTAQGGASNSITLAAGESATNDIYDSNLLVIVGGTGTGQARVIVEYNGTSKVATVDRVWTTTPDATSEYEMFADHQSDIADHGLAQAGGATSITLASTASATNDVYVGCTVFLSTSTGTGQSRLITAYNGTTKVATVSPAWAVNPGANTVYKILPIGRSIVDSGTVTTVSGNVNGSVGSVTGLTAANLDVAVSTRLATAGYTAPLDAAGTRTAVGLASANLDTQLGDLPTANENADALLGRNVSGGSSAGRTVKQALHVLRNKTEIGAGTLTVYDTDDTTTSFTAAVTTTAGDPISAIDPA